MLIRRFNIVIASALLALFVLFNVGIPIVRYLCPMMSSDKPYCECSAEKTDRPAYVYQGGECCGSYILAERNATPYLSVEKYSAPQLEVVQSLSYEVSNWDFPVLTPCIATGFSSAFSPHSPPLFVLNSSLLI